MALLPTKQRDQVMVLVTIVAIALVGLYWYFVFDPKSSDIDKLAAHVDTLDQMNQQAKAEMAKAALAVVRRFLRELRQRLDERSHHRALFPHGRRREQDLRRQRQPYDEDNVERQRERRRFTVAQGAPRVAPVSEQVEIGVGRRLDYGFHPATRVWPTTSECSLILSRMERAVPSV